MIVVIAGTDHQLQPNGEVQSVAVPLTLKNVKNVYMSIAPKDDKFKYVRQPILSGFVTPDFYTSELSKTYMTVYVVEYNDNSEPWVLPTDNVVINAITEE